ncbi:MAG: glycosyltransferase family 4 protein [Verrucomicrobiae bacterium]|nr:glycosyltransferase family 4 protein [Verrucomicrobiae bacterium]
MLVAINTDGLYTTQAGTARYIRGLLGGLGRVRPAGMEWFELAWPVENFEYRQPARSLKTAYREWLWAPHLAAREMKRLGADVLHSTANYLVEPPRGVPNVITVHDLALARYPERFRSWQRWSGIRRLQLLPTAARIICISEFTARELRAQVPVDPKKIEVIYNGCESPEGDWPPEQGPAVEIPPRFLLFVGSLEPGKNLHLLREVYEHAGRRKVELPPLVIVGARWEGVGSEGRAPKNWHYLGRQPDSALVYLYRRALALLFPSKYEGFGLPIAEAMALGTPVICSRVASLPEVAGDAALYADLQPASYMDAILRLLKDALLRTHLIEAGRKQAAKFSWDRCASQTAEVYRAVLR